VLCIIALPFNADPERKTLRRPILSAHRRKPVPARCPRAQIVDQESMPWLPLWPHAAGVFVKYLRLDLQRGEAIALLRAAAGARLPRQRSTGAVIVHTLAGRWKLAEESWIAGPGSVVVLPPTVAHSAAVVDGGDEVLVFVVAAGERIVLGDAGRPLAIDNCSAGLRRYRAWCRRARVVPHPLTPLA
jgi:quercetin dioxygenase-like cupin family protein